MAVFDAHPMENPWDLFDRLIVSRDFLRTERVREALSQAEREWDLAVVDEAHGFTLRIDRNGLSTTGASATRPGVDPLSRTVVGFSG